MVTSAQDGVAIRQNDDESVSVEEVRHLPKCKKVAKVYSRISQKLLVDGRSKPFKPTYRFCEVFDINRSRDDNAMAEIENNFPSRDSLGGAPTTPQLHSNMSPHRSADLESPRNERCASGTILPMADNTSGILVKKEQVDRGCGLPSVLDGGCPSAHGGCFVKAGCGRGEDKACKGHCHCAPSTSAAVHSVRLHEKAKGSGSVRDLLKKQNHTLLRGWNGFDVKASVQPSDIKEEEAQQIEKAKKRTKTKAAKRMREEERGKCCSKKSCIELLNTVMACKHPNRTVGTRAFVKYKGDCLYPAALWDYEKCPSAMKMHVLRCYRPGAFLVHYYGDVATLQWVQGKSIHFCGPESFHRNSVEMKNLHAFIHKRKKGHDFESICNQVEWSSGDPDTEVRRILEGQRGAGGQHEDEEAFTLDKAFPDILATVCEHCRQGKAELTCRACRARYHGVCLKEPFLDPLLKEQPERSEWVCEKCNARNWVKKRSEEDKRLGLTPDWIIIEGAKLFGLKSQYDKDRKRLVIKGLLDPCTNDKESPNIPAAVLYDKGDDGLKASNAWKGHHVILNPEYTASIQWRFINRAIDEVENGRCPAILLVCRNSTDANFFQRLKPYPRVFLRRESILFKDYDTNPISFGIAVFCIAKSNQVNLFRNFYSRFGKHGEVNVPIDDKLMSNPVFPELLERLREDANAQHRDHWLQCNKCQKWRDVPYDDVLAADKRVDEEWTCEHLKASTNTQGCDLPLTEHEIECQSWQIYKSKVSLMTDERSNQDAERQAKLVWIPNERDTQGRMHSTESYSVPKEKKKRKLKSKASSEEADEKQDDDLVHLAPIELMRAVNVARNKAILEKLGALQASRLPLETNDKKETADLTRVGNIAMQAKWRSVIAAAEQRKALAQSHLRAKAEEWESELERARRRFMQLELEFEAASLDVQKSDERLLLAKERAAQNHFQESTRNALGSDGPTREITESRDGYDSGQVVEIPNICCMDEQGKEKSGCKNFVAVDDTTLVLKEEAAQE